MSFNCLLIVTQLISVVTLINAVPIEKVDDVGVKNLTSVPDPVNINGSLTVLDTTMTSIDLTTISSVSSNTSAKNESRDGRSSDELIITNQESIKNESKESDKSSVIRFPREDEIDPVMINSTSSKSPADQVDDSSVSDISLESNSTLIEGLIESSSSSSVSSSSSTVVDLSSPSPSSTSTSKPTTDKTIVDLTSSVAPRIGRSQSDTIDDEINSNLNDTLLILTTLSSIINQSTTNDSLSSV